MRTWRRRMFGLRLPGWRYGPKAGRPQAEATSHDLVTLD